MINRKTLHKFIFLNIVALVAVTLISSSAYAGNRNLQTQDYLAQQNSFITTATVDSVVPTKAQPLETTVTPQAVLPQTVVIKDTRCLIIISGKTYDVTTFQDMHSGGNVFDCGTDMTDIFYSRHGGSTLRQMARYLVK